MDEEMDERALAEEAEEKKKDKRRIIYVAVFGGIVLAVFIGLLVEKLYYKRDNAPIESIIGNDWESVVVYLDDGTELSLDEDTINAMQDMLTGVTITNKDKPEYGAMTTFGVGMDIDGKYVWFDESNYMKVNDKQVSYKIYNYDGNFYRDFMTMLGVDYKSAAGTSQATTEEETVADSGISISNLLITVQCTFKKPEYRDTLYYLCFFKDGTAYSMDYCTEAEEGYSYEFLTRLYSADDSCWDYANNISLVGNISDTEKDELCNYISAIDLDSDFFDRAAEGYDVPDVEETIYYVFYAYVNSGEGVEVFEIQSRGEETYESYETRDPHALTALELVENSAVYSEWMGSLLALTQ